jgi:hypothetical protein
MDDNLNLFLIQNNSKMKNNDEETENKLLEIKQTLKYCLDFIIKHEDIVEQEKSFLREELLNFLKSYININIQIGKKNEKYVIINDILDNLVDKVLCSVDSTNQKQDFKREIKLIKKERNKTSNIINISKTQ